MLLGKQDESVEAGCPVFSMYMKPCRLRGRSLIELRVVSLVFLLR